MTSHKSASAPYSIADLDSHLSHLEDSYLKTSYQLGNLIDHQPSPLQARVYAVAIPITCFIGECIALAVDLKRICVIGRRTLSAGELRTGNIRIGVTHAFEHLRNITGIISGLFIGMYSPHLARQSFLIVKAERLKRKLNPDTAAKLYALAYAVTESFKRHTIDYRICSGTMLGAVRHKGIVPWDDDIDLMVSPSSTEKCKELFASGAFYRETGIKANWQPLNKGWQCFHIDSPKGKGPLKEIGVPFLDVFHTRFTEDCLKIVRDSKRLRNLFTEKFFTTKEWNEPKEYEFGPLKLTGIQDADPYITRHHGRDALNFAYQVFHHDVLASMYAEPLNFPKYCRETWKYELPRRTYLENRSPIEYNIEKYKSLTHKIDTLLNRA